MTRRYANCHRAALLLVTIRGTKPKITCSYCGAAQCVEDLDKEFLIESGYIDAVRRWNKSVTEAGDYMDDRDWTIGDWCDFKGIRYLVFFVDIANLHVISKEGNCIWVGKRFNELSHLPECDSWDWMPEIQYRPFANAAEFEPWRDCMWVKAKRHRAEVPGYRAKIDCYCDSGIYQVIGDTAKIVSWQQAFDELEFENDTPFGLPVE